MSLVRESGKTIVETISKQLENVTKSLIAMQKYCFKCKTALFYT